MPLQQAFFKFGLGYIQLAVLSISLQPDFALTCGMVKQKDRERNDLVSLVSFLEPNRKLHERGFLRTPK